MRVAVIQLRTSVLGQDRFQTKKSVLVLVLQARCCVAKHCLVTLVVIIRDSTPGFPEPRGAGDPGHFQTPNPGVFRPPNPVVSGFKNFRLMC